MISALPVFLFAQWPQDGHTELNFLVMNWWSPAYNENQVMAMDYWTQGLTTDPEKYKGLEVDLFAASELYAQDDRNAKLRYFDGIDNIPVSCPIEGNPLLTPMECLGKLLEQQTGWHYQADQCGELGLVANSPRVIFIDDLDKWVPTEYVVAGDFQIDHFQKTLSKEKDTDQPIQIYEIKLRKDRQNQLPDFDNLVGKIESLHQNEPFPPVLFFNLDKEEKKQYGKSAQEGLAMAFERSEIGNNSKEAEYVFFGKKSYFKSNSDLGLQTVLQTLEDIAQHLLIGKNCTEGPGVRHLFRNFGRDRGLLGRRVQVVGTDIKFHVYTTHMNTQENSEVDNNARKLVKIVKENYIPGDYPPIVMGDFNDSGGTRRGRKIREAMDAAFADVGDFYGYPHWIDHVFYGRREIFPQASGGWESFLSVNATFIKTKHPYDFDQNVADISETNEIPIPELIEVCDQKVGRPEKCGIIADHYSVLATLRPNPNLEYNRPTLVWWEEQNYLGKEHVQYLMPYDRGVCIRIKPNNKMKSAKVYAPPGYIVDFFNRKNCKEDKQWAQLIVKEDAPVIEIQNFTDEVESQVEEQGGSLSFENGNSLEKKISAIKILERNPVLTIVWYRKKELKGRSWTKVVYPSDLRKCLDFKPSNRTRSFKFIFHEEKTPDIYLYRKKYCKTKNKKHPEVKITAKGSQPDRWIEVRSLPKSSDSTHIDYMYEYICKKKKKISGKVSSMIICPDPRC